eukprot:31529-Pelagococcus_subviridis.AAC.9
MASHLAAASAITARPLVARCAPPPPPSPRVRSIDPSRRYTGSHTTALARWTPILKDFSRGRKPEVNDERDRSRSNPNDDRPPSPPLLVHQAVLLLRATPRARALLSSPRRPNLRRRGRAQLVVPILRGAQHSRRGRRAQRRERVRREHVRPRPGRARVHARVRVRDVGQRREPIPRLLRRDRGERARTQRPGLGRGGVRARGKALPRLQSVPHRTGRDARAEAHGHVLRGPRVLLQQRHGGERGRDQVRAEVSDGNGEGEGRERDGVGDGDGFFQARSIHWFPYDRVDDVDADP